MSFPTRALALLAATAAALPVRADPRPQRAELFVVPLACEQFWKVPGPDDSPAMWNQLISFGGCMEDAHLGRVERSEDLVPLVDRLSARLQVAMQFYLGAARFGDASVALRAVYHIGLAEVALMTRARSSIPRASPRYAELHAELEPLLRPAAHLAIVAFAGVEQLAADAPDAARDEMSRSFVRSAHRLRVALQRDWPDALPDFLVASP